MTKPVHIDYEGTRWIVRFDKHRVPQSIKRRKVHLPGSHLESVYDSPYWHKSQKVKEGGRVDTLLRMAHEKAYGEETL